MLKHNNLILNKLINKCFKFSVLISNVVNIDWQNLYKRKPFEVFGKL